MLANHSELQEVAWRYFTKKNGYSLRPDVLDFLYERVVSTKVKKEQIPQFVEHIADCYAQVIGDSVQFVNKESLDTVVDKIFKSKVNISNSFNADIKSFIHILDSKSFGNWSLSTNKLELYRTKEQFRDPLDVFRQQYSLLLQRFKAINSKFDLMSINDLKGITEGTEISLFGIISELKENEFYFEDLDSSIKLEISSESVIDFSICKSCFCLAKGVIKTGFILSVRELRSPCSMEKLSHQKILPFHDSSKIVKRVEKNEDLEYLERSFEKACFCFINNPWIDKPMIKKKLERLFRKFNESESCPSALIFCGELFSPNFDGEKSLYLNFLASLALEHLPNTLFIFVSLRNNSIFPQHPYPESLFVAFEKANVAFLTSENPSRIVYCNQEIVIFDDNLPLKLYKESLKQEKTFEKTKREVLYIIDR